LGAIKIIPLIDGHVTNNNETLFALVAQDIKKQGYSIRPAALPENLANSLLLHQQTIMEEGKYTNAGIGRGRAYLKNDFVRTDEICWITNDTDAGKDWLDWTFNLQNFLNRHLFLGLFSFESHFAHYGPGDYYKRHYDAFRGGSNRVLSVIAYFNTGWTSSDGGELVLYNNEYDKNGVKVVPLFGTLVTFLSEEFPHEVLPSNRDRYSIAGWFRVNSSVFDKVDPPL
jgi:SM-20-related protein